MVAKGTATVNNGQIAAKFLPDALVTEVNGEILFDFDRLEIENLTGNFGGGQIQAFGTLPLTNNTPQTSPLTFNLDDIAVDLKGLYDGGIRGNVNILGSAIEPDITGELTLFDGQILVANAATPTNIAEIDNNGIAAATEYKNLELNLGDNIQIIQPPIFNFHAQGTLKVNGTFNQPSPEGTIDLQRGQVNLFTTQLSLVQDEKNTARFSRNYDLDDPYLDVSLVGSAVETNNSPIPEDPLSSEISDLPASSLGNLQTVRIFAEVEGRASQITNNLELTSSPRRSQTQIVALLGGNFVNTLGRGDSTLGLANLAGSALFGTFNNVVSDAFGLSEFRLFPTQIIDENDRGKESIVGLAGEIAFDITGNISLSALKILNTDIPTQFGLRYRLDDNFVFRGSTNFDDESRFTVEYEIDF